MSFDVEKVRNDRRQRGKKVKDILVFGHGSSVANWRIPLLLRYWTLLNRCANVANINGSKVSSHPAAGVQTFSQKRAYVQTMFCIMLGGKVHQNCSENCCVLPVRSEKSGWSRSRQYAWWTLAVRLLTTSTTAPSCPRGITGPPRSS